MVTPAGPVAALMRVTKRYGGSAVLDSVTLELGAGSVVALMGVNGTGKTTAARLLLRLEAPDAGEVVRKPGLTSAAVFQEDRLCGHLCAADNVRLVLPRDKWALVHAELRAAGLDDSAIAKPVRELSGGQRRRVAIARAMAVGAGLVVLDEPFTGIDAESKPAMIEYVRERLGNAAVLLITHDVAEATALGARVVRLTRGPGLIV